MTANTHTASRVREKNLKTRQFSEKGKTSKGKEKLHAQLVDCAQLTEGTGVGFL